MRSPRGAKIYLEVFNSLPKNKVIKNEIIP